MMTFARYFALALLLTALSKFPPAEAETILFWGTPEEAVAAQIGLDLRSAFSNLQAATIAKQELAQQIYMARSLVIASCDAGVHDWAIEARLVYLLRAKDFYYLPFYMQQYDPQAGSLVRSMQAMSGGELDGGIPGSAAFAFTRWAFAVKVTLGAQLSGSQTRLTSAADNSLNAYAAYLIYRDKAEIENLTRNRKGGPSVQPDPPPEALANAYVDHVLKPAIDQMQNRGDTAALRQWAEDARAAIIAYEKVQITAEQVASVLRIQSYPDDLVRSFYDRVNAAGEQGKTNQAVLQSVFAATLREYYIRHRLPGGEPSLNVEWSRIKGRAAADQTNRLDAVINRDTLSQVRLQPLNLYLGVRPSLVQLADPKPATDWCTGKPA